MNLIINGKYINVIYNKIISLIIPNNHKLFLLVWNLVKEE